MTLTATDDLGFVARASHQVTVSSPPPPPPPPGGGSGPPPPPPAPTVHLPAQETIAALASGSSLVVLITASTVTCPAGQTCTVTVALTIPGTPTKGHRHPKPIVIGTATYRLGGGRKLTPKIKLNARGAALLRRRHTLHALDALTVKTGSGKTLKRTGKLLIHAPAKKRKRR